MAWSMHMLYNMYLFILAGGSMHSGMVGERIEEEFRERRKSNRGGKRGKEETRIEGEAKRRRKWKEEGRSSN